MQSEAISKKKRIILCTVYFLGYLIGFRILEAYWIYPAFGRSGYLLAEALGNAFMLIFFAFLLNDWLKEQWDLLCKRPGHSTLTVFIHVVLLMAVNVLFTLCVAGPLQLGEADNQAGVMKTLETFGVVSFVINLELMAPFIEEIIFRGCIFQPAAKKWGIWPGALIAGVLFGALHIGASVGAGNWMNLLYILDYGGCGVVLCFAFQKTDSIWGAVLTHALFNLISLLLIV